MPERSRRTRRFRPSITKAINLWECCPSDGSRVFSYSGDTMIRRWTPIAILLALSVMPVWAQKKENARVVSAGRVMSEILGMPDNIPADLLQKAECVIV